jgi:UDP-N-acetylmuramoyl-L-alanyl-D-glutamate--2,6-diaminopimelate ligase
MAVIGDIAKEFEGTDIPLYKFPDRREAIHKAYELAGVGDVVLLAGKGHEKYQLINGKNEYFCEREILENCINSVAIANYEDNL